MLLRLYPTAWVIIDVTKVYIEKPSFPDLQQTTFSNYKNNNTLDRNSPSGAITFVSSLFSGSISDKKLIRHSGILELLEKGDFVMADRKFDIEADLLPLRVKLPLVFEPLSK